MKTLVALAASVLLLLLAASVGAQDTRAASATQSQAEAQNGGDIGVIQIDVITAGWSARRDIIGKPVYNEQEQRIGKIDDIIITPDNAVSFAIIGAGGFLGIGKHDVVIPIDHIQSIDNRYVLPGATKAALKALPAFKYKRTQP